MAFSPEGPFVQHWSLDPMLRAVVDDLERCSPQKQLEAVKYVAMLAPGMTPPSPASSKPARKPRVKGAVPTKRKKIG